MAIFAPVVIENITAKLEISYYKRYCKEANHNYILTLGFLMSLGQIRLFLRYYFANNLKSFSSIFNHSNICFTILDLKLIFLCQATNLVLLLLLIVLLLFCLCYTRSFDDVNPFNTWCLLQSYRYSNRPATLLKYVWMYVCISFTTFSMQNIFFQFKFGMQCFMLSNHVSQSAYYIAIV